MRKSELHQIFIVYFVTSRILPLHPGRTSLLVLPEVAMHWEHRFNHMVKRYNEIYRVQIPNITPHVCRHSFCSKMARKGMNPAKLKYIMGHSDIEVTFNTYTHLGFDDVKADMLGYESGAA